MNVERMPTPHRSKTKLVRVKVTRKRCLSCKKLLVTTYTYEPGKPAVRITACTSCRG